MEIHDTFSFAACQNFVIQLYSGYFMLIIGVARSEWMGFDSGHVGFANRFVDYSRGSRNCMVICALDVMVNTVNVPWLLTLLEPPKTRHKMLGFRWMNPALSTSGAVALWTRQ